MVRQVERGAAGSGCSALLVGTLALMTAMSASGKPSHFMQNVISGLCPQGSHPPVILSLHLNARFLARLTMVFSCFRPVRKVIQDSTNAISKSQEDRNRTKTEIKDLRKQKREQIRDQREKKRQLIKINRALGRANKGAKGDMVMYSNPTFSQLPDGK